MKEIGLAVLATIMLPLATLLSPIGGLSHFVWGFIKLIARPKTYISRKARRAYFESVYEYRLVWYGWFYIPVLLGAMTLFLLGIIGRNSKNGHVNLRGVAR